MKLTEVSSKSHWSLPLFASVRPQAITWTNADLLPIGPLAGNKLQWNSNWNKWLSIYANAFENVVCENRPCFPGGYELSIIQHLVRMMAWRRKVDNPISASTRLDLIAHVRRIPPPPPPPPPPSPPPSSHFLQSYEQMTLKIWAKVKKLLYTTHTLLLMNICTKYRFLQCKESYGADMISLSHFCQNYQQWTLKYGSRSKVAIHDTPSHTGEYLN